MKKAPTLLAEASPYKSVAEELETLRRTFRGVCQRYAERVEAEITGLLDRVVAAGTLSAAQEAAASGPAPARPNAAARGRRARALTQMHELRDMLTVLRTLQIKPADGRRKDLKKMESVVADLQALTRGWN